MYRKERREAVDIIRRFLRGEIGEEPLLSFVESLDLRSIHHLFETLELGNEDLVRIGIRTEDIARPLREFLAGCQPLEVLRKRVGRMRQIVAAGDGQTLQPWCPDLGEALSLLGLVLDPSAPLHPQRIPGYLAPVLAALEADASMPFRDVLPRILRDVGSFHFTTLSLMEFSPSADGTRLPWSDLALLYGPPTDSDPRSDTVPEADLAPVWFIPLSVTTRRFYDEGLPARLGRRGEEDGGWMEPGCCLIPELRRLCPSLPVEGLRPRYFIDPRGFAEIVLDVDELSIRELTFAVQLFSLQHGARSSSLEGEPVKLLERSGGCDHPWS